MRTIAPNQRRRLRLILAVVFVFLLVPAATLAYLGYRQLQFESFYQYQTMAADLTARIDSTASALFAAEDAKSFVQFGFLIIGEGNFVQRSPLSAFPVNGDLPGLVSYFQVDMDGRFSTPLLPKDTLSRRDDNGLIDITHKEYDDRLALEKRVRQLLENPVSREPAGKYSDLSSVDTLTPNDAEPILEPEAVSYSASASFAYRDVDKRELDSRVQAELTEGQRLFDRLNSPQEKSQSSLGSVAELKLKQAYQNQPENRQASLESAMAGKRKLRARRLEKNVEASPEQLAGRFNDFTQARLTTFESEVDPFRFGVIDDDHFVLYRNVWRDQQRFVQGAVIERSALLEGLVGALFRSTTLATVSNLVVAFEGGVLRTYTGGEAASYLARASDITGTLLYRTRLTAPLNNIELVFSFTKLPVGPGGTLMGWTTLTLLALLIGGFTLLYRLGLRQIALNEQQQDFVSAVSHELKTPLTAIRMYGEILKAGWASEDKKRGYYDFIFSESERLTRLINNMLRLARFSRKGNDLELRSTSVGELVDLTRSKIGGHLEQAGFTLTESHDDLGLMLTVDTDAFLQIMINLIDNALKFSAKISDKTIAFNSRTYDTGWVEFVVRDYGPGVPRNQMKKIFKLFYRAERELTRETVGTGIGLALVHELATAMGGRVDVVNANPGAEFRLRLPLALRCPATVGD